MALSDIRVLVIEDNPINMELAVALLEPQATEILQASSAREGIELAVAHVPDVIIMDIRMPEMDGITALALLRERDETRSIPVIAVTAHAMKEEEAEIREAGFDGYVPKPVHQDVFYAALNQALGGNPETK